MTTARVVLEAISLWALSLTAACGACEPEPKPIAPPAEASGQDPIEGSPAPAVLPAMRELGARRVRPLCRAIAVDGQVTAPRAESDARSLSTEAGTPWTLSASSEIPSEGWLMLAAGARMVARDAGSGREVAFKGPARARSCVAGREESWVSRGVLESTAGSGESPGAEEWVVTPLGVVRFGAAKLAVEVGAKDTRAAIASGTAYAWLPQDASASGLDGGIPSRPDAEGWLRVGPEGVVLRPSLVRPALRAARASVAACSGIAKTARTLAVAVLDRDGGPTPAARTMQQVATRRLARAACAVAALRLAELDDSPGAERSQREELSASVADAERAWSELPLEPLPRAHEEPP